VCSNPEFLREGSAISDFTHPDRVLVGVEDERAREVMTRVYRPLALRKAPILFSSREAAEVSKYAANAFLAMKISFINEIADLCEHVGADVQEVANAIGADGRIGDKFLHPGPGYGGSCFPKDVSALIRTARDAKSSLSLIEQTQRVNEERKIAMANRIIAAAGGDVFGKTIGVLGVTFKPNTDDMRDAPSLVILPRLMAQGATVQVYDPHGREQGEALLDGVTWCENALTAARDCDVLVVLTEWNEFRALDLNEVAKAMHGRILVDLRNVFVPGDAETAGLLYAGIGRPSQRPGSATNGLAAPQLSGGQFAG
jgi:UDPglucose 6-dehydrogenase